MQAYFMRHAETDYNVLQLANDDPTRNVHLTATGLHQARAAAEQLKDIPFQAMIVSELPRTRHTANIINRCHGVSIRSHPDINDIRTGFDGQPAWKHAAWTRNDPMYAKAPGGESRHEHRRRVQHFIDWLSRHSYHTVLVVAHEETLRVCLAQFRHLDDNAMLTTRVDNCQCFEFTLQRP